jgi:hypothetical protein
VWMSKVKLARKSEIAVVNSNSLNLEMLPPCCCLPLLF